MEPALVGHTLSHYRVTAVLGAGGMGEVYRATDTTLGRDVALKLLPASVASDPERLARFEREAKLLAALSHAAIAQVYGFESATLPDGSRVHVLVMELASGEDLQERLKRGALPLDEAIAVARQVAEALELAHEKGIVHRDLKPANVKLAADGSVKVLDFGLAKAWSGDGAGGGSSAEVSHSPTLTHTGSAGMILGTAAYMSPEQARGKPVDPRADLWALGVLLYEMLTGRTLFEGETVTDVLAAVVRQEIDWTPLPPGTPPALRRLLRQCLERNPKNRLHAAADARLALGEAAGEAPHDVAAARPVRRLGSMAVLGAVAAALGAGVLAGALLRRGAPVTEQGRWLLAIPDGLVLSAMEHTRLALSRDGRLQVAVVNDERGTPRLLLRRSDELEPRLLPDTEGAMAPFFAPDGVWIGFLRAGGLYKMPVAGGPSVRIAETSGQTRGGSWGDDGFVYFVPDTVVGISRVSESGGAAQPVTRLDDARDERTHRWPEAIPGADAVLFTNDTASSSEYYDDARIEVVRPSSGARKVLVENASMARYSPSGHLVFARGGGLFAVPFDARALALRGEPVKVLEGIATDVNTGAVQFSIAPSGALAFIPGGSYTSWNLVWADRQGNEARTAMPPAPYSEAALSPDGTRVALVGGQGGVSDLWVADLERASVTRLTFGEYVVSPVWSPDGSRIAYGARPQGRGSRWQVAWKRADGSQPAEALVDGGVRMHRPSGFSPDGRLLLFDVLEPKALQRDIWMLPLAPPRQPAPLVAGPFLKEQAVVSPDGRFVAYVSDESGQLGVYARPFPAGPGRFQLSTGYGTEPRWSRDGRELFYRSDDGLWRVPIDTRRGFVAGRPELLFDRVARATSIASYTPSPDGRRFFTFRAPAAAVSRRAVALDLGFADRLSARRP